MNARTFVCTICLTGLAGGLLLAQPPGAPPGPRTAPAGPRTQAPATAPAPPPGPEMAITPQRRVGQPVNIRVDVTISDQRGGTAALKKTVSVVTGDRLSGFIRSTAEYVNIGPVPLNVDTEPELLPDGKIRVGVNLQYDLPGAATPAPTSETTGAGSLRRTQIRENLAVILESGKSLVVAQSADPVGDRQVTIEIKATVLR
jgi:hypothetical protein